MFLDLSQISAKNRGQSVDLLATSPLFAYQLIYIMKKFADFLFLLHSFLTAVERKQLTLKDNLQYIAFAQKESFFLPLKTWGQKCQNGPLLELIGVADDLGGLCGGEMLDVGGETGDNLEDELFGDFFGGELFLQMFEDLHAQEG